MADVSVGKLTLKLSNLSRAEGEHLAREIVEGLGAWESRALSARHVRAIEKTVTGKADMGVDELSNLIVAELIRSLERMV